MAALSFLAFSPQLVNAQGPRGVQRTIAGGGMTSGGGGLITPEEYPWFIGNKPVRLCIEKSRDFSLPLDLAKGIVQQALLGWVRTLYTLRPQPVPEIFQDGEQKNLSLRFEYVENSPCDLKNTDLVFYLGVFNQAVRDALKYSPDGETSVGIARQTEFSYETGRAKGFIWVTPDLGPNVYKPHYRESDASGRYPQFKTGVWSYDPSRFMAIVSHELGHVFGLPHIPGTFMDKRLPRHVVIDPGNRLTLESSPQEGKFYMPMSDALISNSWSTPTGPKQICGTASNGNSIWDARAMQMFHRTPGPEGICLNVLQPIRESYSDMGNKSFKILVSLHKLDRAPAEPPLIPLVYIWNPAAPPTFYNNQWSKPHLEAEARLERLWGHDEYDLISGRYRTVEKSSRQLALGQEHVFLRLQRSFKARGTLIVDGKEVPIELEFRKTPQNYEAPNRIGITLSPRDQYHGFYDIHVNSWQEIGGKLSPVF